MKKLLILLFAIIALTSCTKYYLTKDMLTYEVIGQEASIQYYSNSSRSIKMASLNYKDWRYSEPVGPGDSISLFIINHSLCNTSVKIYLGTTVLYDGKTDNTGLLFINYKFHQSDFRLK